MSNRTFAIFAILLLLLVAGQVVILTYDRRQSYLATIEGRATNAGLPLGPEDGRVSVHPPGRPEETVAAGALGQVLRVPAGRYDVRILFSRARDQQARWVPGVEVARGERAVREVEFSAGELSIEATVGSGTTGEGDVVTYVFTPQDHDRIITTLRAGLRALLAAGTYDLRVVLAVEAQEKDVRWLRDVPVRPGLHTRRDVSFRRGALRVVARNAGGQLPPGAVSITVFRAGDVQREMLDEGLAGVPLGLPAGRYDVKATFTASNDRPSRWLREIDIRDGEMREETVDLSSGTVVVGARIANGSPVDGFQVYVYYYRAGDHAQPITYTPAGVAAVVESGRYDLRASFFRSHDRPDIWLRDVMVDPGKVVRRMVTFPSGKLLVRAYDGAGVELVGDNVFVHVYAAGALLRPTTTARSGEMVILTEGAYDIRAEDTRQPFREVWLKDVRVRAGTLVEKAVTFEPAAPLPRGSSGRPSATRSSPCREAGPRTSSAARGAGAPATGSWSGSRC